MDMVWVPHTSIRQTFFLVTFFTFQGAMAEQETKAPDKQAAGEETPPPPLNVGDLVSASTELSARLAALKRDLELGFDPVGLEEDLAKIDERLKSLSERLEELKAGGRYGYERLSGLKAEIVASGRALEKTRRPLIDRIKQVERWNSEWSEERKRWTALKSWSWPKETTAFGTICRPPLTCYCLADFSTASWTLGRR